MKPLALLRLRFMKTSFFIGFSPVSNRKHLLRKQHRRSWLRSDRIDDLLGRKSNGEYGVQRPIFGAEGGGYLHIQGVCALVACVVWERRWGLSLRTMTASILPDAMPKRLRSQAGLHGFWGQVGDRDYDVFVQEAQVHYSLANQFRSALTKSIATGSQRIETREIWLILPEATAFGVRLSHASRES